VRRAFALVGAALLVACGGGASPSPSVPIASASAKPGHRAPDPCARPSPTVDASEALGRPISAVCLRGAPSGEVAAALGRVMRLRAGTTLTAEALRAELARIWETGFVDDITTEAHARGVLDIIVRERPIVTQVTVAGASPPREVASELKRLQGERLAVTRLRAAAERAREQYVEAGFEDANIQYEVAPLPGNLVRVRFTIVEGLISRVGKLTFPGAKKVPEAELERTTGLTTGDVFEADGVARATLLLTQLYYDRGMIQVDVTAERGARGKDAAVPVAFTISEGDVFKLGKLRVSMPSDRAREKTFAAMLRVKPGSVFSRSALVADLERMRGAISGGLVEPETNIDLKAKTIGVTIVVTP
jgi:outer membrane protein insertion porin family